MMGQICLLYFHHKRNNNDSYCDEQALSERTMSGDLIASEHACLAPLFSAYAQPPPRRP